MATTYKDRIIAAITDLSDGAGSSSIAIKKCMQANIPAGKKWQNRAFLTALKKAVDDGDIAKTKGKYRLGAGHEKKVAVASEPKAAPKKKAALDLFSNGDSGCKKKAAASTSRSRKAVKKRTAPKLPPNEGSNELRKPSDECYNCTCSSGKNREELLQIVANVHGQPAYMGPMASRGPLNMESVQIALVDDYIAHSRASNQLQAKQIRLRQALRRIAVKLDMPFLAQFNAKTTSLRTFGKALWDGAGLEEPKKKATELALAQKDNHDRVAEALEWAAANFAISPLQDSNSKQPDPVRMRNLLDSSMTICAEKRTQYRAQLDADGVVLLPSFVPADVVRHLLSRVGPYTHGKAPTKLTETSATGSNGAYYDANFTCEGLVPELQRRIFAQLRLGAGAPLPPGNAKAILLCYARGAENWTHQDDNAGCAYQALLLLSEPAADFDGGALYVLNGTGGRWSQRSVAFRGRGDVVVFRSNGDYFHGMHRVSKGRHERTSRIALGLFHKL